MKIKMKKRIYALFAILLCCCMSMTVIAASLHRVSIKQVYLFKDVLRVYADVEDIDGNSIDSIKKTNAVAHLNQKKLTTSSVKKFAESGEGVADIFLIDISKSLNDAQMAQVKKAMQKWASEMKPNDRMAIITFGEEVQTVLDYSNDPKQIQKAIKKIENTGMKTRLYGAVNEGLTLSTRNDVDLPKKKDIIIVTDGLNDSNGGVSMDDVKESLKKRRIPLYCLWLEKPGNSEGESTMNTLADLSGGKMYNLGNKDIDAVYEQVHERIQNSFVFDFAYSDNEFFNGTTSNLELKVTADGKTPTDSLETYFSAPTEKALEQNMVGVVQAAASATEAAGEKKEENDGDENSDKESEEESDEESEEESDEDGEEKDNMLVIIIIAVIVLLLLILIFSLVKILKGKKKKQNDSSMNAINSMNSMDSVGLSDAGNTSFRGMDSYGTDASGSLDTVFVDHVHSSDVEAVELTSAGKKDMWSQSIPVTSSITVKLLDMNSGEVKIANVQNEYHIGRRKDNDLIVNSPKVSGNHCMLYVEHGKVYIQDMASTNGTKLNGSLVQETRELKTGDMLAIADRKYQVEIEG